ncbi:MAG: aminotransferase class V-fold PLP-dependent enzyme, partial [Proteobacteria bacterium]|nr:aminotransferase class V-fold PLP-dependent enzyme [Pseudomonadota bacterium]MBU1611959.1 aminotransferase class V-fold PLP-dependent enzyme [Pseudomonadota bacterium]
ESSIRSLVADGETVLNVSVGAFGDLYHKMAEVNGKKNAQLKFEYGQAIDLNVLEDKLKEVRPAVVTFTHNETSTGVKNDIVAVTKLIRQYGAMPLVDGVSIFGGANIQLNEAGPAMYSTATQKSMGLPAGFGIGFVSQEAEDKAKSVTNKGHSSDINTQLGRARKFQTVTTPNCTLANMMHTQLDYIVNDEGVKNRFARHEAMRLMVGEWAKGIDGFELFAPEGYGSPTLTTVLCPAGVTSAHLKKGVKEAMRGKGYLMDPGYGKLNTAMEEAGQRLVIRIGHMGDITPEMLTTYLTDLKPELEKL